MRPRTRGGVRLLGSWGSTTPDRVQLNTLGTWDGPDTPQGWRLVVGTPGPYTEGTPGTTSSEEGHRVNVKYRGRL